MAVSREFVIDAFVKNLGRKPESEETISHYMACEDEFKVVRILSRSKEYFKRKFDGVRFDEGASLKLLLIGNCQVAVIKKIMESMCPQVSVISIGIESGNLHGLQSANLDISQYVDECDSVIFQTLSSASLNVRLSELYPGIAGKAKSMPSISYTAFQPDMGYVVKSDGTHLVGPMGEYHSMLAFWAWENNLSVKEAVGLFRHDVFQYLGYYSHAKSADHFLLDLGEQMGLRFNSALNRWKKTGCFMHSINHPKLFVLADVARLVLEREGIEARCSVEDYLFDDLSVHPCWPVYPEIARFFGVAGSYDFKQARHQGTAERPIPILTLDKYVSLAYSNFNANRQHDIKPLVESEAFSNLSNYLLDAEKRAEHKVFGGNPYTRIKGYQLWRKGVAAVTANKVDPVVRSNLKITRDSKVATAGSCFAQHISRTLANNGFTYYVPENGGDQSLNVDQLAALNYGVFSARYGNIYTSKQLIQLFDRAYGRFSPLDEAWQRKDGMYVDPFRPLVAPDGYQKLSDVKAAQAEHFHYVREMFEKLDVFVFTLGLTEAWRRIEDGAIFPLAPGVEAGLMDSMKYEFVNFETHDVVSDLEYFIERLAEVNPRAKIILTVSPVPLVATYEDRHVLTSTTYSKAALRSAADYIVRRYPNCEYFPSYEIITGSYSRSSYFEPDLRGVRDEGVGHVMRLFMQHYSSDSATVVPDVSEVDQSLIRAASRNNSVVCDEEALDSGA